MLPLKEAIAEKHSLAEKMTFNQRMFRGELSNEEYILYLSQQLAIFDAIEIHELPHPSLDRAGKVFEDIKELMGEGQIQITPLSSTNEYRKYLNTLTKEELLPHVYLNYLAIMFGGQMMKSKILDLSASTTLTLSRASPSLIRMGHYSGRLELLIIQGWRRKQCCLLRTKSLWVWLPNFTQITNLCTLTSSL